MDIKIEEIVEKYSDMIMQISFQRCFNKSEAEDITQEVFIKLYRNFNKIKNEEHMKAWLIRVTINLCNDYNKNFWNKNSSGLEENIFEFSEIDNDVFNQIKKLKDKYRDIIYLYYYQSYKINEISKILNMKENTVSSNLTRARKQLKEILEDGGDIYEKQI